MPDQINRDEPRVLEYRKQVKLVATPFKYFVFVLFVLFIGAVGFLAFQHLKGSKTEGPLTAAIGFGMTWLLLYLEYVYLLKPLATSKIQVFKDRLLIRRGKKEIIVPFNEITQIKGAVKKSLGGWFKLVMTNGKAYRFTVVLERVDYIIDAVIAFNPKLMDQGKYFDLRTNLILADHGLARLYSFFGKKYRWITAFHLLFFPAGFTAFLFLQQGQLMMIRHPWSFYLGTLYKLYIPILILGTIALMILNSAVDKTIRNRLRQFPENKLRNVELESSVYRKVFPAYILGLIGLFAVVHQYDLNALSWTSAGVEIPHLNIHRSETVWVDTRFNCLKCRYTLQRDDNVLIGKRGQAILGKVVGVPGEVAQINTVGPNGRYLASTGETTIPESKVAVRVNPNGSVVTLVDVEEIRGRVSTDLSHFLYPTTVSK